MPGATTADKPLPRNLDAERSVLGAMILDREAAATAMEMLGENGFYSASHQKIYDVVVHLFENDLPVDLTSIAEHLERRRQLDEVGGPSYLLTIVRSVATSTNIHYHASIVKDKANRRRLIETCARIMEKGIDEREETENLLNETERLISAIAEQQLTRGFQSAEGLIDQSMRNIEQTFHRKNAVTGLDTGYARLNKLTAGLQASDLIILAARPSVGKTAFALNLAQNVAVRQGVPVGVFSLEMSADQVIHRLLCSEARVAMKDVRTGFIGQEKFEDLAQAANRLMGAPIYVDDTPAISLNDIVIRSRRLKSEQPELGLIIVDYIQLITGSSRRSDSREQEVAAVSRGLKALARDLGLPVIALSQLSRAIERRDDPWPRLSDLRESGAIEQDADIVMFIHRNTPRGPQDGWGKNRGRESADAPPPGNDTEAYLLLRKHRNGPIGDIPLYFIVEYMRFETPTDEEPPDDVPPF